MKIHDTSYFPCTPINIPETARTTSDLEVALGTAMRRNFTGSDGDTVVVCNNVLERIPLMNSLSTCLDHD